MKNSPLYPINEELLVRFLSGDTSGEEERQVNQWLEADERNRQYFEELSLIWKASASSGSFKSDWIKEDWNTVKQKLVADKKTTLPTPSKHQRQITIQIVRIAAVLALVTCAVFLLPRVTRQLFPKEINVFALTKKDVTLPDGTIVYLNAGSKLTYPEGLNGSRREVKLEGEAFFEVTKNKDRPFVIRTGKVSTEVVGTSFNVMSDKESKVTVTVVTGKVLMYLEPSRALALSPGERGNYFHTTLEEDKNSDTNFLSWKTNTLIFKNAPLKEVVHDLMRHYHQSISLEADVWNRCTLTTTFKDQTLDEVLNELNILFAIDIERKGNTIMIKGKGC